jgi:hypothetical protein
VETLESYQGNRKRFEDPGAAAGGSSDGQTLANCREFVRFLESEIPAQTKIIYNAKSENTA